MERRLKLIAVVVLVAVLPFQGCAVQRSQAPQIDSKTVTALNIGETLKQLNTDYKTFFIDVGTAQRTGQLSVDQVGQLNTIGHGMKTALDSANSVFASYSTTYDQGLATQLQGYITTAAQLYAQLIAQKAQMQLKGKV